MALGGLCLFFGQGKASAFETDQILVRFWSNLPAQAHSPFAQQMGAANLTQLHTLKSSLPAALSLSPLSRTFVLKLSPGASLNETLQLLRSDPRIELAEPDISLRYVVTPNDTQFSTQYALHNTGQSAGTAGADVDAALIWDTVTGSATAIVAIIDSGVDWDHVDLAANIWDNSGETVDSADNDTNGFIDDVRGYDFGDSDNNPDDNCFNADPLENADGHGTHVAGIAAAVGNNSIGVSGAGWSLKIMPLKVASSDCQILTSNVVNAITYAINNGAKVINMSLAGGQSATLEAAVDAAFNAGLVVVAAAGNENTTDSTFSFPAAYTNVISVASTDNNDIRSSFSNYGTFITLSAPGSSILSTLPGDIYGTKSGTSMATPLVVGIAGLLFSQFPTLTPTEVLNRLTSTAEDLDTLNPSFATQLGAGRVNAVRALMTPSSASPSTGLSNNNVNITLLGTSLIPSLSMQLTKTGETSITGTNVTFNGPTSITGTFDLTSAATGQWDIVITTDNTTKTLSAGFTVEGITISSAFPSFLPNTGGSGVIQIVGENFSTGLACGDVPGR